MTSILTLHQDAWTLVLPLLSAESIANLRSLGIPVISDMLRRNVCRLEFAPGYNFVDLDRYNRWSSSSFLKVTDLCITKEGAGVAMWPIDAQLFSSELTSLNLTFNECIPYFLTQLDMATRFPNLVSLFLGGNSSVKVSIAAGKFPPRLERLSLLGSYESLVADQAIPSLPKTLIELTVRGCTHLTAEKAAKLEDYPPGLQLLRITFSTDLDQLPHGLKDLAVTHEFFSTSCAGRRNAVFPFRAYFPKLVGLSFLPEVPPGSLRAILDPAALQNPEFERLRGILVNDPVRSKAYAAALADASSTQDGPYAKYKQLLFEFTYGEAPEKIDDELLPFLSCLTDSMVFGIPPAAIAHMPHLLELQIADELILKEDEIIQVPAHLTSLDVPTGTMLSSFRLQDRETSSKAILSDSSDTTAAITIPIPTRQLFAHLTKLVIQDIDEEAGLLIPPTLTFLSTTFKGTMAISKSIKIRSDLRPSLAPEGEDGSNDSQWMTDCDKAWRAIASRLVRLKTLEIHESVGCPSMALTPILSPYFETFKLMQHNRQSTVVPWLSTLLDGMNTAGRPAILPPSTRSFTFAVSATVDIPFEVLAMLPRSLTMLKISHMSVSTHLPNSPLPPETTPTEIMKLLPPNLVYFMWLTTQTSYGTKVFVDQAAILSLPQSLRVFSSNLFEVKLDSGMEQQQDGEEHFNQVAALMPKRMTNFAYGDVNSYDPNYFKIHKLSILTGQSMGITNMR